MTIITEIVEVSPRCEKEIGSIENGWHACGRMARWFSDRELPSGGRYRLYFCDRHEAERHKADLRVRVVQTGNVVVE
jgi:hypothetical protein